MNCIERHISWLLIFVFGLIVTPKELIHEFYGHEDTHCSPGNRLSLESHHHHCEILQITSPDYTSPERFIPDTHKFIQAEVPSPDVIKTPVSCLVYFNLRAPPLLHSI
jgi:hypothetical protein